MLNSCLKLLEVQSGPGTVRSACNDGGTGVDTADACGLREKNIACYLLRDDLLNNWPPQGYALEAILYHNEQ